MAKYRHVQTNFWNDPDILEYTPEDKFFYLYILTNPHTTQCGIYEISIKQMEFETGYNRETVLKLIDRFENTYKKIKYNPATKEMAIKNWAKYNVSNSPKVKSCIEKEIQQVRDTTLIDFVYPIDSLSIDLGEKEKEKEKEKENKDTVSDVSPVILTAEEQEFLEVLSTVENYPVDRKKDLEMYRNLKQQYPQLDLIQSIKDWAQYKLDKPLKKNSNPRSQINNSFKKYVEWGRNLKKDDRSPPEQGELLL